MRKRVLLFGIITAAAMAQAVPEVPEPPEVPAAAELWAQRRTPVPPAPRPPGTHAVEPPTPPVPPAALDRGPLDPAAPEAALYARGTRMIERMQWDKAIEAYNMVIAKNGTKAEGSLYWKAYAARRLGRTDEALAAITQLESKYPKSRWINDAKALEIEVKQASGKPISPEDQSDEELKVFAIHTLAQQSPERALPLLEKVLFGSGSPAVKSQALFVLSQMQNQPKAREILLEVAKGRGNPDVQLNAIHMLGMTGNAAADLAALYNSNTDSGVKRTILDMLAMQKDVKPLVEIARKEKDPNLKREAVHRLAAVNSKEASDLLIEILEK